MKRLLLGVLRIYKRFISPLLPPACRFEPTCSVYAMEAIEIYGPIRGVWIAMKRLLRCHPFTRGGFDPVPLPGEDTKGKDPDPWKNVSS